VLPGEDAARGNFLGFSAAYKKGPLTPEKSNGRQWSTTTPVCWKSSRAASGTQSEAANGLAGFLAD
jgi:hypothetical protein